MGSVADLSQLVNTLTGGTGASEQIWFYQDNRIGAAAGATPVVGQFTSLWTFNMMPGGQGAAPGSTARNPTRTTPGALGQSDPTGGRQKYIAGAVSTATTSGVQIWYDRLADISGLNATTITAQNTTGLAVSRYTGAASAGNQIWIEIFTIIGTTATTISATYTNQAGTSGRVTPLVVFGGTNRREATRIIVMPLAAGDTGVRSVESVTVTATTGTAGNFGVVIARPLVNIPIGLGGTGTLIDCLSSMPAFPEVQTGACLSQIWFASTTTSPITVGSFSMVEA